MQTFSYARPATLADAIDATSSTGAWTIAGGTELVNWMKEGIVAPHRLIDLNGIPGLDFIEADDRGLTIGSLARMSDVAAHPMVRRDFPAISEALLKSASAQLRNMATMGGNLMQRTRCPYFRAEAELACNMRRAGSGCAAMDGEDRAGALFGWSTHCIATHPSDVAVALAALDAVVVVQGAGGQRRIAMTAFYRAPGEMPGNPTVLEAGELIVAISVPASQAARFSHYVKVRERASYEFALVSAAAGVALDGEVIRTACIALGGVAHKPWRLGAAERALQGVSIADAGALRRALEEDFAAARPGHQNAFKPELARRAAIRALQAAGGAA